MTYNEVSNELIRLGVNTGGSVYCLMSDRANTTTLYLPPIAWFVAFEPTHSFFVGTYEGEDLRSICTQELLLPELTPELLEAQIKLARRRWLDWRFGHGQRSGRH